MRPLFTGDVRRQLNVTTQRLERLFERRPDLEPSEKAGGRRIFTPSLVRKIEAVLDSSSVGRAPPESGGR